MIPSILKAIPIGDIVKAISRSKGKPKIRAGVRLKLLADSLEARKRFTKRDRMQLARDLRMIVVGLGSPKKILAAYADAVKLMESGQ